MLLDRPVRAGEPLPTPSTSAEPISVELLPLQTPPARALLPDPDTLAPSVAMRGGERMSRPDTGAPGRGGDGLVVAPAVNLAPRAERAHLTRALRSRLERAQEARQRDGDRRQAPEDDTVTLRPTILTFFAEGRGDRELPRRQDVVDGQRRSAPGQWRAGAARRRGTGRALGPRGALGDGPTRRPAGDRMAGNAERAAAGLGIRDDGERYAAIQQVELKEAEPMALRGRPSNRSDRRGPASDDVTSEQEVMQQERSLLAASTPGGRSGSGRGGEVGRGEPGSGGLRGSGSVARALGDGRGPGTGIDPADARRRRYLRRLASRVQNSWSASAFPKWAALEGRGGTTIVGFVVRPDGRVSDVVTLRPSGFPDFDARMRAAVRRAAPFGPPPADLRAPFRHSHTFAVTNPAVRPHGE
jgi:TonB family protein